MIRYSSDEAAALRIPFLDHIKATGTPETFPGLVFTRPDQELRLANFVIISRFSVGKKYRPAGLGNIPCSLCSGKSPKYLKGSLVHFDDGYIRLFGHICAATHLGKAKVEEALAAYKNQTQLEASNGFLAEALPKLPKVLAEIEALKRRAELVQRAKGELERSAPLLMRVLRRLDKTYPGILFVEFIKPHDPAKSDRSRAVEHIDFGRLDGYKFLASSYDPLKKLSQLLADFDALKFGNGTNALESYLKSGGSTPHLAKRIQKLGRGVIAAEADIVMGMDFMLRANLTRLKNWHNHPATVVIGGFTLDAIRARVRDDGKTWANVPFSDGMTIPSTETIRSLVS
jgi:hypothetical protein